MTNTLIFLSVFNGDLSCYNVIYEFAYICYHNINNMFVCFFAGNDNLMA